MNLSSRRLEAPDEGIASSVTLPPRRERAGVSCQNRKLRSDLQTHASVAAHPIRLEVPARIQIQLGN